MQYEIVCICGKKCIIPAGLSTGLLKHPSNLGRSLSFGGILAVSIILVESNALVESNSLVESNALTPVYLLATLRSDFYL